MDWIRFISCSLLLACVAMAQADEPPDASRHWAFAAPTKAALPVAGDEPAKHPVDAFIFAKHREHGLTPAGEAPREMLLRRVYVDLIGLPPTPEQRRAFLADTSPDAYEKVVDQLLASPRYGERWGRHWMDVWRYSDWYGYKDQLRNSQRHIWRWRDWIIESLNADMGYDRMVTLMLAADETAPTDRDALRATGYLARNYYKFNRHVWLDDTIEHTAKAFLGLTLSCARCHDHKYDPIAQVDYYRFRAIFEPHHVRTDRLPGEPDVNKDGLPRVYDQALDAKTYLFEAGDDKRPDKSCELTPAAPVLWERGLPAVEPVELPAAAWYPGMRPFVQNEALAAVQANLSSKQAGLAKREQAEQEAREALDRIDETCVDEAKSSERVGAREQHALAALDVTAWRGHVAAAQASLAALQARIAADRARYADPPAPDADELARAANAAEREAALSLAQANVDQNAFDIAKAQHAFNGKPEDAKPKKALADAEKLTAGLIKKRDAAKEASAQPPSTSYAPLTEQYPRTSTGRRSALAAWIVSRDNPLTARVAVNHIWLRHFGQPLVPTVFDFGLKGAPPSHRDLLDWLAVEFMEQGWSMKHLHRLIVTSRVYRMHSTSRGLNDAAAAHHRKVDPDNRLLWKMNARRMEAEAVRDSVLHVSGRLDEKMGGPEIDEAKGLTTFRRSVYYRHAHEKYMTFLKTFDTANIVECYQRDETLVPQQGLAMANSRLLLESSRVLAGRLMEQVQEAPSDQADTRFVEAAFERVLGRQPTPEELGASLSFLQEQAALLAQDDKLTPFNAGPKPNVKPANDPSQRARENLVHVLFNHNDFITIR